MGTFLYSWELGEDLGHISNFLPLALELRARGHRVVAALRELGRAEAILARHGIPLLQAPVWLVPPLGAPHPPQSFAEMLIHYGFTDPPGLAAMVRGWRNLMRLVQPDLMIADHAPTALLAGRSLGLRSVTFGSGFVQPPFVSPLPKLRAWADVAPKRLVAGETQVLATANAVLARFGVDALHMLADIYRVEENFLMTYPELDPFPLYRHSQYRGVILSAAGAEPNWPPGQGPKVFAYLKPDFSDIEIVLTALTAAGCRVILFAGNLPSRARADLANSRVQIGIHPYDIGRAAAQCDLALCHSGQGTVAAMLLAGKPLLLLPQNLEQFLMSQRVAQLGAGLLIDPQARHKNHAGALRQLLGERCFTDRAREFAAKYAGLTQSQIISAVARRCEDLLRSGAPRRDTDTMALD